MTFGDSSLAANKLRRLPFQGRFELSLSMKLETNKSNPTKLFLRVAI